MGLSWQQGGLVAVVKIEGDGEVWVDGTVVMAGWGLSGQWGDWGKGLPGLVLGWAVVGPWY
jgi:hypothetical protein